MLVLGGPQPANAGADENAHFVPVGLLEVEPRVLEGLPAGVDAEMAEAVGAANLLRAGESGSGVEIPNFSGDLAVVAIDIEQRDAIDAALAGEDVLPKGGGVVAEGRDDSQPSDDDTTV